MKKVLEIKDSISDIPNIFWELDPEDRKRGEDPAIETLWDVEENDSSTERISQYENINECNENINEKIIPPEEIFEIGSEIDEDELTNALGGDRGEEIKKSIEIKGVEALAWYFSFHNKGVNPGIYIPISSILYLTAHVFNNLETDFWTKFKLSFRAIHQHELFHFACDYMAAQWEAIFGRACKKPALSLKDKNLGYNPLEEKLANAHMLRSFRSTIQPLNVRRKIDALREFIKCQPEGYRDACEFNQRKKFIKECESLIHHYIYCIDFEKINYFLKGVDLIQLFPIHPQIDWRYSPIHIIHDEERINIPKIHLDLFQYINNIQETDKFMVLLKKLPTHIKRKWERLKKKLSETTTLKGLDFKQWERKKDSVVYSVRLDNYYRAHLEYLRNKSEWLALKVGTHKEMGHG